MKLPSATAGSGMSCERCGRESRGAKDSHFSFCPDCRLFVCDRCWDATGMACEGCVGKRKAESTVAAFLAASEGIASPPRIEPPAPAPIVAAGPVRGPNGRFLPRAGRANGSSAASARAEKEGRANAASANGTAARGKRKGKAPAKAGPRDKPAVHERAGHATPRRTAKHGSAVTKPLSPPAQPAADAPAPIAAMAISIPPSTPATTGPVNGVASAALPSAATTPQPVPPVAGSPVGTMPRPASPSSEAFRASILNSIGTPDVAWQVMARPGMPAPTRVPVGPARPAARAPKPLRRTARARLPAAGRLARGIAIRLAMAVILAVAALVVIAAAMTLTGGESGTGAFSAPPAAAHIAAARPTTAQPSQTARGYVIQPDDRRHG